MPARGFPACPPLKTSPRAGFPGAPGPGDVHAAACGLQSKGLRALRCRVSTKSTPCHRKSAEAVFRWEHPFAVKWHFRPIRPETLILRPEIDIGSGFQPPARGLPARPSLKTSPRAGFPGATGPGDVHALGCRPASAENGTLYRFPGASAPADYSRGSSPDTPRGVC